MKTDQLLISTRPKIRPKKTIQFSQESKQTKTSPTKMRVTVKNLFSLLECILKPFSLSGPRGFFLNHVLRSKRLLKVMRWYVNVAITIQIPGSPRPIDNSNWETTVFTIEQADPTSQTKMRVTDAASSLC